MGLSEIRIKGAYRNPTLRELRDQQKKQAKPKQAPIASNNSKTMIINNLGEEIKRIRVLKDELNKVNQALTGRLYKLQRAENLAEKPSKENEALLQQIKVLLLTVRQPALTVKIDYPSKRSLQLLKPNAMRLVRASRINGDRDRNINPL